jgi:hypothetical protein
VGPTIKKIGTRILERATWEQKKEPTTLFLPVAACRPNLVFPVLIYNFTFPHWSSTFPSDPEPPPWLQLQAPTAGSLDAGLRAALGSTGSTHPSMEAGRKEVTVVLPSPAAARRARPWLCCVPGCGPLAALA